MAMIDIKIDNKWITGKLHEIASKLADFRPLLEDMLEGVDQSGQLSMERAQRIPLKPSTIKRKRYARRSAKGAAKHEARKAERLAELEGKGGRAASASAGLRRKLGPNATAKPKPNARVLERVGGFIESLSPPPSDFDVREIKPASRSVRYGTKLGGLWRIFGASGRLDFMASEESREEVRDRIELAQADFVARAIRDAGGPSDWADEVQR